MGMRWRFVLAPCTDPTAGSVGARCQPLLAFLKNPIKLSLLFYPPRTPSNRFGLLEMVAFANREPEVASVPPNVANLVSPTSEPALEAALSDLRSWAQFMVAQVASEVVGEAYFGIYSDTLNCSGLVHFVSGSLESGYVYGLGGTDTHLRIHKSRASHSVGALQQYHEPLSTALEELFPGTSDPMAFLEAEYEPRSPIIDYLLMEKRALVTPPRRLERGTA